MDDIVIAKVASIQRCVQRAREEYAAAQVDFDTNYTRQDAAILNVVRACELAIDLANHTIRQRKLGIPTSSRESFELLRAANAIDENLLTKMTHMVGFRNVVIHSYQQVDIAIVRIVVERDLNDVLAFADAIVGIDD